MIPYLGTLVAQAERKAGRWGLWWIGIVSVACGLVAVLSPAAALRVPAALALVLVLPGYAVVARLTKAGSHGRELWLLVPALSIVVTILIGLALALAHLYDRATLGACLSGFAVSVSLWGTQAGMGTTRTSPAGGGRHHLLLYSSTIVTVAVLLVASVAISVRSANSDATKATSIALWSRLTPAGLQVGLLGSTVNQVSVYVVATRDGRLLESWQDVSTRSGSQWQQTVPDGHLARGSAYQIEAVSHGRVLRMMTVNPELELASGQKETGE